MNCTCAPELRGRVARGECCPVCHGRPGKGASAFELRVMRMLPATEDSVAQQLGWTGAQGLALLEGMQRAGLCHEFFGTWRLFGANG